MQPELEADPERGAAEKVRPVALVCVSGLIPMGEDHASLCDGDGTLAEEEAIGSETDRLCAALCVESWSVGEVSARNGAD